MPRIELLTELSPVLLALAPVVAVAVTLLAYRFTRPAVSGRMRLALGLLRATALTLMLSLPAAPVLRLTYTSEKLPTLAVLVDNSQSMRLADRQGERARTLEGILRSDAVASLAKDAEVRQMLFGTGIRPRGQETHDAPRFDEPATDIAGALRTLADGHARDPIGAALLLTDGISTLGRDPLYEAERLPFPVMTVGIGDTAGQLDVIIARVAANEIVYQDVATPVDVTLRASGTSGQRVEVALSDGGTILAAERVLLKEGTRDYSVPLAYTPRQAGTHKYTVSVSSLPGEVTTANNRQPFYVRVLKSTLGIVLLAGGPSPDVGALRQAIAGHAELTLQTFVERRPSGYYGQAPSRAVLDSADCIILLGVPTGATSPATRDMLRQATVTGRTPVLFVAGRDVDYGALSEFAGILPFRWEMPTRGERLVSPALSREASLHPLFAPGASPDAWNRLPPIFATLTVFRPAPGAQVLVTTTERDGAGREILIVARSATQQNALAILGYGLWRWQLLAAPGAETQTTFSQFLRSALEWLTTRQESRPVRVAARRAIVPQGEAVDFLGQVYDAGRRPVDGARVTVGIRLGDRRSEIELRSMGNGRYEGALTGLGEGDYTFEASASAGELPLGADTGRFSVGGTNLEFQETRMNASLLRGIAEATGGRFFTSDNLDSLPASLRGVPGFASVRITRSRSVELWNVASSLIIMILALGAEWALRKRSGLL